MGEYEYETFVVEDKTKSLPDVAKLLTLLNEEDGWRPVCLLRHFGGGALKPPVYVFLCERRKGEGGRIR